MQPPSKRGKLRKTQRPITSEQVEELALLRGSDSDADSDSGGNGAKSVARALLFDIGDWRTRGEEDLARLCSFYTSTQLDCDTERWLQQSDVVLSRAATTVDTKSHRKQRMDALTQKRKSLTQRVVSSFTVDMLPVQLRTGPTRNFEAVLMAYGMQRPWAAGYVEIQPDSQPDHANDRISLGFLNKFVFSIGVWWMTGHPGMLYLTLEAEHVDGCGQCTYSVPCDQELEIALIACVCDGPLPR
jgi:hypothetical protein